MTFNKQWFDGSVNVGTPFGWDAKTFPNAPRIHLGQDYAPLNGKRKETIAHTIISGSVRWIIDGQGNSILRQSNGDYEIRYYHFNREEVSSDILAALIPAATVEAGTVIGPAGNVGLKVAGNGNDGSHVHLVIVCKEEMKSQLTSILGEGWAEDMTEKYSLKYGDGYALEANRWRVRWMNDKVIYRFDPLSQKYAYFLNPAKVLGV